MELTQEHFDKTIKGLVTRDDIKNFATKSDIIDIRGDMKVMESRLIEYIDKSQEELAEMVARGFADIVKRLDVREKVEVLEVQMHEVRLKLNFA